MTIVTLVHGTFAKKAKWIQQSSSFAAALSANIGGEVRIEPFHWSGWNLHISRVRAAKKLQNHIRSMADKYSEARQVIIAHSHGGNVALYALKDPDVHKLVSGVSCLSTPFILCRSRPMLTSVGATWLLLGIVIIAIFHKPILAVSQVDERLATLCITPFVMLGLLFGPQAIVYRLLLGRWSGSLSEIVENLAATFKVAPLSSRELLIVRAPGDEASAGLGASTFGMWLVKRISIILESIYQFGARLESNYPKPGMRGLFRHVLWSSGSTVLGWVILHFMPQFDEIEMLRNGTLLYYWGLQFVGVGLIGLGILFWVPTKTTSYPNFVVSMTAGFDLLKFAIQLASVFVAMPFLIVGALLALSFGWDMPFLISMFDISVETSPVGNYSILSLSTDRTSGLWHSLPYSNNEALQIIVKWIHHFDEHPSDEFGDRADETHGLISPTFASPSNGQK